MAMRFDFFKMQAVLLIVFIFCFRLEAESRVGVFRDETSLKIMVSVFPLADPLSGLEIDIKIAKVINSVPKTS